MSRAPTPDELARYGFIAGAFEVWCACCGRTGKGRAKTSFKCCGCATKQFEEVERICDDVGINET
jgi:hypothetical protein